MREEPFRKSSSRLTAMPPSRTKFLLADRKADGSRGTRAMERPNAHP